MTASAVAAMLMMQAAPPPPAPLPPLPSSRQLAWKDLEFTGFIHFGPNTFTGQEWGHGDEPAEVFAPTALDARQWVKVMKDAGMRGVVITAKHHDGFCLWPSKFSAHTVAKNPWKQGKGDVLRELSDACREGGLKFGVYLSPWDRHNPLYGSGEPYNACFRDQLREVLTSYGPVFEVWFDGACGEGPDGKRQVYDFPSFRSVVRELQPDAVMFSDVGPDIRWVGNEQGWAGETCWSMLKAEGHGIGNDNPPSTRSLNEGDIDGESWIPAECDVSIRPGWFHHAHEDDKVKTPSQLFDLWERSVGHNANFHLNLPVDRRGLIHENDVTSVMGLRRIIDDTYGPGTDLALKRAAVADNVRGTASPAAQGASGASGGAMTFGSANAVDGDPKTYWATDDGTVCASIDIELDPAKPFDRVVLAEPTWLGQRIKAFRILVPEGDAGNSQQWRTIAEGTTVGHKRIVRVPLASAPRLRVEITDSRACPALTHVGVHRTVAADPAGAMPAAQPR
jgi:alpha-L-fucosidase